MSESLITKRAIATALKQLCREKPFEKISIADITAMCGLNRQTFYYHFQDKYELLSWIYYTDNFEKIADDITLDNWHDKILLMLHIMISEKFFYMNTVKEPEHTFESYLLDMAKALFLEAIDHLDEQKKLTAQEKGFDAEFYAYGICGVILSWTENGMKMKPEEVTERLISLVRATEQLGYIRSQDNL